MKKIFNWLFGSFFRTLGRVIAFIVIGGLLFYFFNSNGFFDRIDLSSLFGIRVNASTLEELNGTSWVDYYTNSNKTNYLPTFGSAYEYQGIQIQNMTNGNIEYLHFYTNISIPRNTSSVEIPFIVSGKNYVAVDNDSYFEYCDRWQNTTSSGVNYFTCNRVSGFTNTDSELLNLDFKFQPIVRYGDTNGNDNGNWNSCSVENNKIVCPISNSSFTNIAEIRILYNSYSTQTNYSLYMNLSKGINFYKNSLNNINNSLQEQIDQQHQDSQNTQNAINNVNDSINDDNIDESTSEASSFFNDFTTDTHGLTSIITAPLNSIQSLTSKNCSSLQIPIPFLNNKKLVLPCMRTIYEEFFGDFMDIYDVICIGIVSYWIMVRIFNLVKDFKNPDHDEIEVMDL